MGKPKKKNRKIYNTEVVNALIEKYGFTKYFIQQCLRGDRNSITADQIRKDYKSMTAPTQEKIAEFKSL
ncbi:MAG TPA: hypothetical protein VKY44_05915 [Flavobacterium sp.]|nr:hypothetical protein [Flavobacterium sp.]